MCIIPDNGSTANHGATIHNDIREITTVYRQGSCWGSGLRVRARSAFTLAEITVVLVLLGIIVSVVLPRIGGVQESERLRTAARRLAGLALEAHSEAAVKSRPWFLCLDLEKRTVWLSSVRPGQEGEAGRESRFVTLPFGVGFKDALHPETGLVKEGRVSYGYWPQGGSEPGTIHLITDGGEEMTIFLRPFLGRSDIEEGYLREETK